MTHTCDANCAHAMDEELKKHGVDISGEAALAMMQYFEKLVMHAFNIYVSDRDLHAKICGHKPSEITVKRFIVPVINKIFCEQMWELKPSDVGPIQFANSLAGLGRDSALLTAISKGNYTEAQARKIFEEANKK